MPSSVQLAFESNPRLSGLTIREGVPELKTPLPPRGAKGDRNHDVWLRGFLGDERVGVGIEAKADEEFDKVVSVRYRNALKLRRKMPTTQQPERIAAVVSFVLGRPVVPGELAKMPLRYQLFTGVAGTLIQAARDGSPLAVFVVFELVSSKTTKGNLERNSADYQAFLAALPTGSRTGTFVGPLHYPKSDSLTHSVELWIGKVSQPA